MIVCCEEENCIGGGAECDDFVLVFVEVRVVINEEDGVLEGEEVRQGHGAEIGDIDGKEYLEESHDDGTGSNLRCDACSTPISNRRKFIDLGSDASRRRFTRTTRRPNANRRQ